MFSDHDLRRAVASLLYGKIAGDRRFVARTGARGFLRLTKSGSRIGPKTLATVGPVSGGLRFSTQDRVVVIERGHAGYRVLARANVAGAVLVLYDCWHGDVDSIAPALLDALGATRA